MIATCLWSQTTRTGAIQCMPSFGEVCSGNAVQNSKVKSASREYFDIFLGDLQYVCPSVVKFVQHIKGDGLHVMFLICSV